MTSGYFFRRVYARHDFDVFALKLLATKVSAKIRSQPHPRRRSFSFLIPPSPRCRRPSSGLHLRLLPVPLALHAPYPATAVPERANLLMSKSTKEQQHMKRKPVAFQDAPVNVLRLKRQLFGVRRLVAALPFRNVIFVNWHGKTTRHPFQFQVKSTVQTKIVARAKLPEKESGDESPHSKGRLFRASPILRLL